MVYLLRPPPQAKGRCLHRVQAGKAVGGEDVVPVPQIVLERNGLFEYGIQDLSVGLRRGLAHEKPFQLVFIACILARGGEVCALQCLEYPRDRDQGVLGRCGRGERLDEGLQVGNAVGLGGVMGFFCGDGEAARACRGQLQPIELAVNPAHLAGAVLAGAGRCFSWMDRLTRPQTTWLPAH